VSVKELERCPTQALAFGVSDEGSEQPSVGQAAGTAARFTVTRDSLQLATPRPPRRGKSTLRSSAIRAPPR
jgi:hypothetical protein